MVATRAVTRAVLVVQFFKLPCAVKLAPTLLFQRSGGIAINNRKCLKKTRHMQPDGNQTHISSVGVSMAFDTPLVYHPRLIKAVIWKIYVNQSKGGTKHVR